jgi:DNA-binding CsgD family transcriptional regulator/PAS domain-containing protein
MIIYSLLMFAMVFLVLALGCYTLWLNARDKSRRLFFMLSLATSLFTLFGVFVMLSEDMAGAWFWFRFASVFIILFFPLLAHFCISLTTSRGGPLLPAVLYALSIPLHVRNLFSTYMFESITHDGKTWLLNPAIGSFWMYYWFVYAVGASLVGVVSLLAYGLRASTAHEKKQSLFVSISILIAISLGIIESFVAQLFNLISATPFFINLIIFGVWVAMLKYRLLSITDNRISRQMLDTMEAFIIMLDINERIVMINRTAEKMLAATLKQATGRPFSGIIGDNLEYREGINGLKNGRISSFSCRISLPRCGEMKESAETQLAVQFSMVRDASRNSLGFMALGHELKGLRKFIDRFRITAREWETIHSLVTGATNREIAKSLGIAERTVKAHLSSVYGKLCVENKVQMIAVLKEYGLY